MGGLNGHPYANDPWQRQGNENIMLRPFQPGKGAPDTFHWYHLSTSKVGDTTTSRNYVDQGDNNGWDYPFPGAFGIQWLIPDVSSMTCQAGIDVVPGNPSHCVPKTVSDSIYLVADFLDKDFNVSIYSQYSGTFTLSFTGTGVSYSATISTTGEMYSFNTPIRGEEGQFYENTVVGPSSKHTQAQYVPPSLRIDTHGRQPSHKGIGFMDPPTP